MTGKIEHDCEIEGCDLPWEFYLYCGSDLIIEVCKKHKYDLIIKRTEILAEFGEAELAMAGLKRGECDFVAVSRDEVENF